MSKSFWSRIIPVTVLALTLMAFFPTQTSTANKALVRQECPQIIISCPYEQPEVGKTYTVSVDVKNIESKEKLSYHWSFSSKGGEIVEGQGTASIKILVKYTYDTMTATVKICGMEAKCKNSESCSFSVA